MKLFSRPLLAPFALWASLPSWGLLGFPWVSWPFSSGLFGLSGLSWGLLGPFCACAHLGPPQAFLAASGSPLGRLQGASGGLLGRSGRLLGHCRKQCKHRVLYVFFGPSGPLQGCSGTLHVGYTRPKLRSMRQRLGYMGPKYKYPAARKAPEDQNENQNSTRKH